MQQKAKRCHWQLATKESGVCACGYAYRYTTRTNELKGTLYSTTAGGIGRDLQMRIRKPPDFILILSQRRVTFVSSSSLHLHAVQGVPPDPESAESTESTAEALVGLLEGVVAAAVVLVLVLVLVALVLVLVLVLVSGGESTLDTRLAAGVRTLDDGGGGGGSRRRHSRSGGVGRVGDGELFKRRL